MTDLLIETIILVSLSDFNIVNRSRPTTFILPLPKKGRYHGISLTHRDIFHPLYCPKQIN